MCTTPRTGANEVLQDLAAHVSEAMRPPLRDGGALAADVRDRDEWRGHRSLPSNELSDRADLRAEVEALARGLAATWPASF